VRISPASALILLLFLPVACSNADSLARSYATRDSSGVEIVSNGGARCTPDNTWILDLHSTFGEVDGQLAFGYIESMALAPNGELFVLDDLNKRILVFGPEGRFLATFGRAGDGPGEFRFPRHVGVLGEDLIAVGDGAPSRLHVLTGRGDFVRQIRVEPPADAAVTGLANVVADWKVVPGTGVWAALRRTVSQYGSCGSANRVRWPIRSCGGICRATVTAMNSGSRSGNGRSGKMAP